MDDFFTFTAGPGWFLVAFDFIGEQSGNLEASLLKVSNLHMEEASHAVRIAVKFLGVAIVLAVALLIGYIVISFYTNLYGGMFDALGV